MNRKRLRPAPRTGAATVEFAVSALVFLMFVFAVCEYGRMTMAHHLVQNAAREGVRYAVVNTAYATEDQVKAVVKKKLAEQPFQGVNIKVYKINPSTGKNAGAWTTAANGEFIAVEVDATFQPLLPTFGFLPTAVPLHSRAMMRCEANG
jgi:Flp pilus assembly protein TadG